MAPQTPETRRTLNELLRLVHAGTITPAEAAAEANPYALEYFDARTVEDAEALRAVRAARAPPPTPTQAPQAPLVTASCGHRVTRASLMHASLGTSCVDCYDTLSG